MLVRRPHLLSWTKPRSCNKPDQGKQLLLPEHQASFLIILFLLKCPDRRKESWRSQMRHRFNQDSCSSFKKSFNSMTEVPPGNLVFSPFPFPFPFPFPLLFHSPFPFPSSSYLPIPTMAKLPLNESMLFAVLSNASLCTEAACFPACLLVAIICPYPVAVGLGMTPNIISQGCNVTLEK